MSIRIRYSNFETITRSRTLPDPTDVTTAVHAEAVGLFDRLPAQRRIRLVGVRVEGLRPRPGADRQLTLGERERGWAEADRAVDRARNRFGSGAVRPATLLGRERP